MQHANRTGCLLRVTLTLDILTQLDQLAQTVARRRQMMHRIRDVRIKFIAVFPTDVANH